jgi:hypothetical protein
MTNFVVGAIDGRPIRFLDVSPLIAALRTQPSDFEFSGARLLHVPTCHSFQFDRRGNVAIDADCGCSALSVRSEQGQELFTAFNDWREEYWQPLEQNREFASHFRKPNAWLRLFRDIRMAWRRFRGRAAPITLTIASQPTVVHSR